MFVCLATKPLNDNTKGFRFNFFGIKGLTRKRKRISRGFSITKGNCMTHIHIGKRTVYLEKTINKVRSRRVRHFAG